MPPTAKHPKVLVPIDQPQPKKTYLQCGCSICWKNSGQANACWVPRQTHAQHKKDDQEREQEKQRVDQNNDDGGNGGNGSNDDHVKDGRMEHTDEVLDQDDLPFVGTRFPWVPSRDEGEEEELMEQMPGAIAPAAEAAEEREPLPLLTPEQEAEELEQREEEKKEMEEDLEFQQLFVAA
ncbi:hypothetical protein JCM5296_005608 [Sporobolomyces johnsonii]